MTDRHDFPYDGCIAGGGARPKQGPRGQIYFFLHTGVSEKIWSDFAGATTFSIFIIAMATPISIESSQN